MGSCFLGSCTLYTLISAIEKHLAMSSISCLLEDSGYYGGASPLCKGNDLFDLSSSDLEGESNCGFPAIAIQGGSLPPPLPPTVSVGYSKQSRHSLILWENYKDGTLAHLSWSRACC